MKWNKKELQFLTNYDSDARPYDVYQDYISVFGDIRSYSSIQKKMRALAEDEDDDGDISTELSSPTPASEDTQGLEDDDSADSWDEEDAEDLKISSYKYDQGTDEYHIPTRKGILHVSGSRIRQLLDDYSNYGAKKTINMVARDFGWARHYVIEVLRRLGKTHDSAPFTDEQIIEEPVEKLVEDLTRKRENRIIANSDKEHLKLLEKDAHNWRRVKRAIAEVFENREYKTAPVTKLSSLKAPEQKFDAIIYHTDAHVGKLAAGWRYEECREVILRTAERALSHTLRYGRPNRIITGIGGDWSNIDNPASTTTRGTPQRSNEDWFDLMEQANQIQLDLLQLFGETAPTEAFCVPGNHDRMWSVMAGSWLAKMFANHPHIKVHTFKPRHYIESGKNMIMLTHGDGAKPREYPAIMAAEAAEMWGRTQHRYAYHGHLHHEVTTEYRGVSVNQMPSISPEDEWHVHEGYVGNRRALTAHLHDWKAGRVAQFNIAVGKDNEILG